MTQIQDFTNRILEGDCIHVLKSMPSASIDLVVTDPPYLVRYHSRDGRTIANDDNSNWLGPAFAEMSRVLKDDRFCISFYGWDTLTAFLRHGGRRAPAQREKETFHLANS